MKSGTYFIARSPFQLPLGSLVLVCLALLSGCQATITEVAPAAAPVAPPSSSNCVAMSMPVVAPLPTGTPSPLPTQPPSTFAVSGTITYDWIPATDANEGGIHLDYTQETAKPARRIIVKAMSGGSPKAQTLTDDSGNYTLYVLNGNTVTIRAVAESKTTGYTPDGIPPDYCNGASWDVQVVDSSQQVPALYVLDGVTSYNSATTGANLHAVETWNGTSYTTDHAPPFAMLDTILHDFELVCSASPAAQFPQLLVNWYRGNITGTYFTLVNGIGNLFIVGKVGVDTDEYDDHVIAHETGHFIENSFYRADTIGGTHSLGDSLDPRVAFSEGWGNSVSGMAFQDPIYVDTSGANQASGFQLNVSTAPSNNDRGIFSETSIQYLLYTLFANRLSDTGNVVGFDRINNILENFQRNTPAFTTGQTFAAYYSAEYGLAAEGLAGLWSSTTAGLATPTASLSCNRDLTQLSGSCDICSILPGDASFSNGTPDIFDFNNAIGLSYSNSGGSPSLTRIYPESGGTPFTREFWRQYRVINSGVTTPTAHDVTNSGSYGYPDNKFGINRWYVFFATDTQQETVSVPSVSGSTCATDVLDMYVYGYDPNTNKYGQILDCDTSPAATGCSNLGSSTPGCPIVQFNATAGRIYIIALQGFTAPLSGWNINITSP